MMTFEERRHAYKRLSTYSLNRLHIYQCRIMGQNQLTREQYNNAINCPETLMGYICEWSYHNQIWMCQFAMYATDFDNVAKIYHKIQEQLLKHMTKLPSPFRFNTPRVRRDRSSSSHSLEILIACLFMNLFQYINDEDDNRRIDTFVDIFDPCVHGEVYTPINVLQFWSIEELSRLCITEKEPRKGSAYIYIETLYHSVQLYTTHKLYLVNALGEYKRLYCHERVALLLMKFPWDVCLFKRKSTLYKVFYNVFECSIYNVRTFLK